MSHPAPLSVRYGRKEGRRREKASKVVGQLAGGGTLTEHAIPANTTMSRSRLFGVSLTIVGLPRWCQRPCELVHIRRGNLASLAVYMARTTASLSLSLPSAGLITAAAAAAALAAGSSCTTGAAGPLLAAAAATRLWCRSLDRAGAHTVT